MNRRSFFKRAGIATAAIATGSILELIPEEKPKFIQQYPLTPDEVYPKYEMITVQSDGENWKIVSDFRKDLYDTYFNGKRPGSKGGIYPYPDPWNPENWNEKARSEYYKKQNA